MATQRKSVIEVRSPWTLKELVILSLCGILGGSLVDIAGYFVEDEPPAECRDEVLDSYRGGRCSHADHMLFVESMEAVCRCVKPQ